MQHTRKASEHSASLLLALLIAADSAFIVLHILNATPILNSSRFNIAGAGGYAETYQSIELFWIVILLAYVLRSTRYPGYLSWILVFAYLFLDSGLHMRATIGRQVAERFDSYLPHNLSLQPRHFGEFAVLAIAGTFLSLAVVWAYSRGPHAFRKISNDLLLLIAVLVFFGVFVDLTAAIGLGPIAKFGLGTIEDGGEMVAVSLVLWYVFRLAIGNGNPDLYLRDLLYGRVRRRCI